jgi:hypothetical protein
MRIAPFIALAACLCSCEMSVYSTTGVSASTSAGEAPHPSPLEGWTIQGHASAAYRAEVDQDVQRDGHATIRFHPVEDPGGAYGTFMTSFDARPFRGRRAHAVVFIRTQGVTARGDVWLRAQAVDSPPDGPGLATSITQLAANADFRQYELLVDVPDGADKVQLGIGIAGPGMLWMDGVKVEAQ